MDNSIPKKNEHKPTSILSHTGTFTKKKRVLAKMKTYPRLTRDSALPHHQIHLPIWKRLWLSHKTLKHPKITIKIQKKKKGQIQTQRERWFYEHEDDSSATPFAPPWDGHAQCLQTCFLSQEPFSLFPPKCWKTSSSSAEKCGPYIKIQKAFGWRQVGTEFQLGSCEDCTVQIWSNVEWWSVTDQCSAFLCHFSL